MVSNKEKKIVDEEEKIKTKFEINNDLDEDNLLDLKKIKAEKDAIRSENKKGMFTEDKDEDEDWNMLPPFLRKKK